MCLRNFVVVFIFYLLIECICAVPDPRKLRFINQNDTSLHEKNQLVLTPPRSPGAAFYNPSEGTPYFIYSASNGKVMEVGGYQTHHGANVQTWPYKKSNWQKWQFYREYNGYYQIRHYQSQLVMDIIRASLSPDVGAVIWGRNGADHQLWRLEYENGSGLLTIRAKHSGQCLEVYGNLNKYGNPITQYPCSGTLHQKWYLFPASGC